MNTSLRNDQSGHLISLDGMQLLLVKGPDAAKFLQGQVTCDIRTLDTGVSCIGAQCNHKGRILLTFRALKINELTIALRIPSLMLDSAVKNLAKYIVFSKAEIIDAKDAFYLYGICGTGAEKIAAEMFSAVPDNCDASVQQSGDFLIKIEPQRYECWISASNKEAFETRMMALAKPGTENDWTLMDIRRGTATVVPDTVEIFTPQDINYQLVNAVSFRKGCYTGQEIVARLHYRGKLKRHMFRFKATSKELPSPGSAISNNVTHQNAGLVVMAARINENEIEILASVVDEYLDNLVLANGAQKLKLLELPYAIPTADENIE